MKSARSTNRTGSRAQAPVSLQDRKLLRFGPVQAAILAMVLATVGACSPIHYLSAVQSKNPEALDLEEYDPDRTRLVGDYAVPFGMFPVKVEAVGLVSGLRGTGSDPRPSPQRQLLLSEMQSRGIEQPNTVLASSSTALVLVRGVLRPGIQKGDCFDLEVRIPARSETTSLRGGYLLETRLREMAVLQDNRIHDGHVLGLAEGPLLVDPTADEKADRVLLGRARILGGGVCLKSRPLALVLKPERQSVLNSARIETAVNRRFHTFHSGLKTGMAKAKTDEYVELTLHPRYKDNVQRYVQVVRSIALQENEADRRDRMVRLKKQLSDAMTASRAALQLEAIGTQSLEVLREGIHSENPEVRFYSAEAMAYLDQTEAAAPLGAIAREYPAFRVFALTALSAMDDYAAYEQLADLLHVPSAETRYGAFRALWAMNPNEVLVRGDRLADRFSYHVIDTTAPPMVHVTRSQRPELILFGKDQQLVPPLAVEAGNQIMVTSTNDGGIRVSKYSVGEADQKRLVGTRLDEVVRAIVELGGTYPDVVQALHEAKACGALASRLAIDAVPQAGRTYVRNEGDEENSTVAPSDGLRSDSPMPDLFVATEGAGSHNAENSASHLTESAAEEGDSEEKSDRLSGFVAKMKGLWSPSD